MWRLNVKMAYERVRSQDRRREQSVTEQPEQGTKENNSQEDLIPLEFVHAGSHPTVAKPPRKPFVHTRVEIQRTTKPLPVENVLQHIHASTKKILNEDRQQLVCTFLFLTRRDDRLTQSFTRSLYSDVLRIMTRRLQFRKAT